MKKGIFGNGEKEEIWMNLSNKTEKMRNDLNAYLDSGQT